MLFFLLFICPCASTITDEEQENYKQQQHTDTSTEIVSYILDHSSFYDDYSYVKLLLLKFMCSCTSTRTITGQQQHEMVTTTTTQ